MIGVYNVKNGKADVGIVVLWRQGVIYQDLEPDGIENFQNIFDTKYADIYLKNVEIM